MRLGITGGRVSTPASLPGDSLPAARTPTRRSNQRTRLSATSHCVSGACRVLHGMRMHVHVCGVGVGVRACVRLSVCLSAHLEEEEAATQDAATQEADCTRSGGGGAAAWAGGWPSMASRVSERRGRSSEVWSREACARVTSSNRCT